MKRFQIGPEIFETSEDILNNVLERTCEELIYGSYVLFPKATESSSEDYIRDYFQHLSKLAELAEKSAENQSEIELAGKLKSLAVKNLPKGIGRPREKDALIEQMVKEVCVLADIKDFKPRRYTPRTLWGFLEDYKKYYYA